MTETRFQITHAGPHISVQDGGRKGRLRFGVPASGAMDRLSLQAANLALGNPADAAAIEVSLGGLTLHCTQGSITLAVAGGGFIVESGEKLGSWQVLTLHAGQRLIIRPGTWGAWTYLAFAGDLQSNHWLGSQSTHGSSGLGGGKLTTGGEVLVANSRQTPALNGAIPCPIFARPCINPRILFGPQDRFFDAETLQDLHSARFTLTSAYDRMGVRLAGPILKPHSKLTMPSEPLTRGSVQVAGDGIATVLLADHQTTGGYPKIATILDCDLDAFAQLRPNDALKFKLVTPGQAIAVARLNAMRKRTYFQALIRRTEPI
jgi:allophanate hydrolase